MSGGYFDYEHHKISDIADRIKKDAKRPLHKALAKHLYLVYEAVRALDYEWSGDTGRGEADEDIKKIVKPSQILACTKEMLEDSIDEANKVLREYEKYLGGQNE